MNRIKCVLFDLDGTLINTNRLIIEAFRHTFMIHLKKEISDEEIVSYFGEPLEVTFSRYTTQGVSDMVKTFQEFDQIHHGEMVGFFPGVSETISNLYYKGIKLGIITSKQELALSVCDHWEMVKEKFSTILTIDDIDEPKPSPKPVLKALEELGCSADKALMVGDSPLDIISAKKTGVLSGVVGWSMFPREQLLLENPDYIIERFVDLIEICSGDLICC